MRRGQYGAFLRPSVLDVLQHADIGLFGSLVDIFLPRCIEHHGHDVPEQDNRQHHKADRQDFTVSLHAYTSSS